MSKRDVGAPESSPMGPIGGGEGYADSIESGDFVVTGITDLRKALGSAQTEDVIFVPGDAEIDMTVCARACREVIEIPGGVTLAGGRGIDGAPGAMIYSDEFETQPLIRVVGDGARVTGLRIGGPDQKVRFEELIDALYHHPEMASDGKGYYSFPTSNGIETECNGLTVDNCEIWGWGCAGVNLRQCAKTAHIHHNDIHHCQRAGLGYGICFHGADGLVEFNRFDYTRHAIAGSGVPGTAYEARFNIHGPNSTSHCFDMHGSEENSVLVEGRSIAGDWMKIHHNTFESDQSAVGIRALPGKFCEVHLNWFRGCRGEDAVKLYGEEAENDPTAFGINGNVIGPDQKPGGYPK